jgi:predicted glutamine amidotransferase
MCRFVAYKGRPIVIDEILYHPKNSLIRQSAKAHESEEPLNGDGFGLGWYVPELGQEPALFTSVRPAWNDRNLRYLSSKIKSPCVFAHVRAASTGEVSEANCHPFHYKNYLFMHNGGLEDFQHIKRYIRRKLSDEVYDWVHGQTDSEHFFALFIENMKKRGTEITQVELADALEETVQDIQQIKDEHGVSSVSYINVAITDGEYMIAMRYVSTASEEAPTLYFSEGSRYECSDGVCVMKTGDSTDHAVLIVSEKLTNAKHDWKKIPANHMLLVDRDLSTCLRKVRTTSQSIAI